MQKSRYKKENGVAPGSGRGVGRWLVMGTEFQFEGRWRVLEIDVVMV